MQIKVKQMDQINYPSFLLEFHFLAAGTSEMKTSSSSSKINYIHFAEHIKRQVFVPCAQLHFDLVWI